MVKLSLDGDDLRRHVNRVLQSLRVPPTEVDYDPAELEVLSAVVKPLVGSEDDLQLPRSPTSVRESA